ncbi:MAG TPA: superoxide dismutase family protein, partial [Sphingopyxis sp.]|nr:superoxide dismutase family protein [Sphingopyxis sp.]
PAARGGAALTLMGARVPGGAGLIEPGGAAFVIHAGPDDMKTDPAGNSGARVACGVIELPAAE